MSGIALDLYAIYNLLLAGKRLELLFPDAEEANKVKVRLHQIKRSQELQLVSVGHMIEEERQTLKFEIQTEMFADTKIKATLYLMEKKKRQTYEVIILDDEPEIEQVSE